MDSHICNDVEVSLNQYHLDRWHFWTNHPVAFFIVYRYLLHYFDLSFKIWCVGYSIDYHIILYRLWCLNYIDMNYNVSTNISSKLTHDMWKGAHALYQD